MEATYRYSPLGTSVPPTISRFGPGAAPGGGEAIALPAATNGRTLPTRTARVMIVRRRWAVESSAMTPNRTPPERPAHHLGVADPSSFKLTMPEEGSARATSGHIDGRPPEFGG